MPVLVKAVYPFKNIKRGENVAFAVFSVSHR
jgi:hypothetical protein